MTRELLLLRHGKSDWSRDVDDFHRPLTDRGKRGAQRQGVWLARQGLRPDHVRSSPAERALVTAQKTLKAMGGGAAGIVRDQRIYAADLDELLAVLGDCPAGAHRCMLVGHNPGMEQLLSHLAGPLAMPEDGKLMPTAALARLSMPADWMELGAGCARLLSLIRPAELEDGFPFPSPHGEEKRERPAYYYSQSSVIPYRVRRGKPEILVILSSKKKHYVVPKGIKDPGLSPQASAAKEALEEAGVEGRVEDQPVGSYQYEKWGATCTVEVYPMEVTRLLPEDEWEERHRGREWVSPGQAAERLKQPELAPMVEALAARLQAS